MKFKILTSAIAAASVMVATGVAAEGENKTKGHSVVSAIPLNINFEAYGALNDTSNESSSVGISGGVPIVPSGFSNQDTTDYGNELYRLGFTADLKEDTVIVAEFEINPDSASSIDTNELYIGRTFGTLMFKAGRVKIGADAEEDVELADRLFGSSLSSLSQLTSASSLGLMRRGDGGQLTWNDAGFFAGGSIYTSGANSDSKTTTTGPATGISTETDFELGLALSGGWVGQFSDAFSAGFRLNYFNDSNGEVENSTDGIVTQNNEIDRDGFSVESIAKTGPVLFGFNYAEGEETIKMSNPSVPSFQNEKVDASAWWVWAAWNVFNADRAIGVDSTKQGPQLASGQQGLELAAAFGQYEHDSDETFGSGGSLGVDKFSTEEDRWKIAVNYYCGSYTKFFLEYSSLEGDESGRFGLTGNGFNDEYEQKTIRFGARVNVDAI